MTDQFKRKKDFFLKKLLLQLYLVLLTDYTELQV